MTRPLGKMLTHLPAFYFGPGIKWKNTEKEIRRNLPSNIKIESDSMIRTETTGKTSNSETEKAYRNWNEREVAQLCPTLCDLWTVAHQAPPSMGFSREEYWSGLPFPSPGDIPDPGIEPRSPTLQADALTSHHQSPTYMRIPFPTSLNIQSLVQRFQW